MYYFRTRIQIAVFKQNNLKKRFSWFALNSRRSLENDNDLQSRPLCFAASKQYIWWMFRHLGKRNRRVIPSCVVWTIRKLFPEANRQYTWFKEGERY